MKTRIIVLFALLLMVNMVLIAQIPEWQWATKAGGSSGDDPHSISTDDAGNSYVTGGFVGTAYFGSFYLTGSGNFDVFVAKMDVDGNWLWATKASGTDDDRGYGITRDTAGNIYVSGIFNGTATFGSYSLTGYGYNDIFVAKMDQYGVWQWATKAGGTDHDNGYAIKVDGAGNSYVTGYFYDTATFGSFSLMSYGSSDIFVAKIDQNGVWQWATKAGGTDGDHGFGITMVDGLNYYVTGAFYDTATFGSYSLTTSGDRDIFVAKIDQNGVWQWATKAGGISYDDARSITIDDDSNCYVTGSFQETATFGLFSLASSGDSDIFVAEIDQNGVWQWAEKAGGIGGNNGQGIVLDGGGNCYVTGYFSETAAFGSYSLTSSGGTDIFVAQMDASGMWQWATQAVGPYYDFGVGIALDGDANSYVTGTFSTSATFGSYTLNSSGYNDLFVAKLGSGGSPLTADFTADITSGTTPLTVNFTDLSTGNPTSWEWDFNNDGTIDSYEQNPQWTYYERGSFTVELTVFDGTNEDTELKEDYISLLNSAPYIQNPLIDFSFDEDTSDSSIDLFSVFDDPDLPYGDSFSFSYSGNDSILVEILNGVVTLTPLPDWFGSENITFTAFDDNLVSISDDVFVTIINVNDPPVLIGFSPQELEFTVYQDSIVTFFVEVEDIDSELNYAWFVNTYIQTEISDTFIYQFSLLGEFEIRSEVSDEEYQIDTIWDVTVEEQLGTENLIPAVTELKSNFPNPFNPETTISFSLVKDAKNAKIEIYNLKGQEIKTFSINTSTLTPINTIIWNGKDDKNNSVSSGIYLYKLNVNGKTEAVKKCLLLK